MSEIIEDGTGKGFKTKVDAKNRLATTSVSVEEVTSISSTEQSAYTMNVSRTITGSAFEEVMIFEYTGEYQFQIDSIKFSREDVALASTGQCVVEVDTGAVYTSGGDLKLANNLNLKTSNLLAGTLYNGTTDIVVDDTDTLAVLDTAFTGVYSHEFKGALILGKNNTIAIKAKSLNIGDIIHAVIFGYEVKTIV